MSHSVQSARVTALFVKPERHQPARSEETVTARKGFGLVGDCHAQPLGPRQVLVVRDEWCKELDVTPQQLRANIAISGLEEDELASGRVLRIDDRAQIRLTHECEVCKILRDYVDGETFRGLPGKRGALGVFLAGGTFAVGDAVSVSRRRFPVIPDALSQRAAWVIERIPLGRVIRYDILLTLIGAKRAHFRVLPTYVRMAHRSGLPAHRVLTSASRLTGHVPGQRAALTREGVQVDRAGYLRAGPVWEGANLFTEPQVAA